MKFYTIADIEKIIENNSFKFIGLLNQNKECLIPFNQPKAGSFLERWETIKNRLNSVATDGIYIVELSASSRKATKPDAFFIKIGNVDEKNIKITEPIQMEKTPEVRTYNKALEDQIKIKHLEIENEAYKNEIEELKAIIEELEAEIEERETLAEENAKPDLMENAKNFLSQLMEFGTPLLDKHFALKEQQLNLEARKLLMGQQQAARPEPQQPKINVDELIQNFIRQFEADEILFNQLAEIYNNAESIDDFKNKLNNLNPEIYEQFRQTIQR